MSTIVGGHYRGFSVAKKRQRRHWSDDEKCRIVAQAHAPGVSVSQVARRYDVNANLVFKWLRDPRFCVRKEEVEAFLPVEIVADPAASPCSLCASSGTIEIVLRNGHRLSISGAFDPDAICRLVRGLC